MESYCMVEILNMKLYSNPQPSILNYFACRKTPLHPLAADQDSVP